MPQPEDIRFAETTPTRLALGRLGTAEGLDEDVISYFSMQGYEVSITRTTLGKAACTYADIFPPVSQEDLEHFGNFLHNAITYRGIDAEAVLGPNKIILSTY